MTKNLNVSTKQWSNGAMSLGQNRWIKCCATTDCKHLLLMCFIPTWLSHAVRETANYIKYVCISSKVQLSEHLSYEMNINVQQLWGKIWHGTFSGCRWKTQHPDMELKTEWISSHEQPTGGLHVWKLGWELRASHQTNHVKHCYCIRLGQFL